MDPLESPKPDSVRKWRVWTLWTVVFSVLLVGPPLVIIQGTPRAHDWPWLALVGICLAGVGAGVPFALQGWARRFPRAAMRVERVESSRWFLPAWVVAAAVTVRFVGFEKGMSTLVPTGVVMALLAWHGRSARGAKDD